MKFTFKEWKDIRHHLEVARLEYERSMQESTVSDKELSCYQIFKRQMEETQELINKLDNMEI